jgi:hypothetical protein
MHQKNYNTDLTIDFQIFAPMTIVYSACAIVVTMCRICGFDPLVVSNHVNGFTAGFQYCQVSPPRTIIDSLTHNMIDFSKQ